MLFPGPPESEPDVSTVKLETRCFLDILQETKRVKEERIEGSKVTKHLTNTQYGIQFVPLGLIYSPKGYVGHYQNIFTEDLCNLHCVYQISFNVKKNFYAQ